MLHIIKPGTKYDFLGSAPTFVKVSIGVFTAALLILVINGLNLGLDFAGGHEILLRFEKPVEVSAVRSQLNKLFPGVDTSVQTYDWPEQADKTFYLVRIERSDNNDFDEELAELETTFKTEYGDKYLSKRYNAEAGDVISLQFAKGATVAAGSIDAFKDRLKTLVEGTKHRVRVVRQVGRPENLRFDVQLRGVDATLVEGMQQEDPTATAVRVEFVGPTIGRELRDDGILAVLYAMIFIMIYVAIRFDLYYSPGAILCLFHDAIITTALLSLLGQEFTLATIAGLLTLVGYSINDTIVVFDRIRETLGKAQGQGMSEVLNRAINETLGRTLMTSITTLLACVCLMIFGAGTVLFSFGLIMTVGILIGTYSSIYVASPTFKFLRERFAPKEIVGDKRARQAKETVVV